MGATVVVAATVTRIGGALSRRDHPVDVPGVPTPDSPDGAPGASEAVEAEHATAAVSQADAMDRPAGIP